MSTKSNGASAQLSAEAEQVRMTVVEQELSARSFRAHRQKMEDTIAIEEMQEKYEEVLKLQAERTKKMEEARQAFMEQLQKQAAEKQVGNTSATETARGNQEPVQEAQIVN